MHPGPFNLSSGCLQNSGLTPIDSIETRQKALRPKRMSAFDNHDEDSGEKIMGEIHAD
jgi:hypothetical protein